MELPILIAGKWRTPAAKTFGDVHNPSTGEVIARTPFCGAAEVDEAVQAAQKAFVSWSQTPAPKRATVLFKYRSLLEAHLEELAKLVTRENGKTLDEARGDVRRGFEVVEFATGIAHLQKGESLPQVAEHIDGVTMREPLGVCAGISPFNFPAMVPMWMYPLAIACGNSFILKPSEKVPLTAIRLAELFIEAGLPEGVFSLVHGGAEVVDALCTHPGIAAVSFVGSSKVAAHVYALGAQHGKRVQAGGGAKNFQIVMEDAEPDSTIRAVMGASFGCAGQRCMAGSVLVGVGAAGEPLQKRMLAAMDALKVDDTSANPAAEMGPVIDANSQKRVLGFIERGGAKLLRDGRQGIPKRGFFVGPTLYDGLLTQEEIFGPVLSLVRPASLDEAIALANRSAFGNGATLFTTSGKHARQFALDIQCGMVGINVGVPAPMSIFPFTGWNASFFGDLHMQGTEGVQFYTRQRVVLSRWDAAYRRQQGW
ncbi:MAG: Malonate-semialdehyde dehydrogenase [Verrucomicrobiae bacterium]|nr:Malonate-semialdehyde dehydrogenase [Verrucomicrobiae bacterium]